MFAVPDWGGPSGAANGAGTKGKAQPNKKAPANKKANSKVDIVSAVKPKPSAAAKPNVAGSFVRPPKPEKIAAQKRKLVQLPTSKKSPAFSDSKPSPAKKQKLNGKQQPQSSKVVKPQPKQTAKKNEATKPKPKSPAAHLNGKAKTTKPIPTTNDVDANPFQKKEKVNLARVTTKLPKKKPVKPAKPLALADEESDSELAAEVNLFRKKLLKGFTGAREVGGKPDPNAKFSDDDASDLGLSDSEDEPPPKRKNAKKAAIKDELATDVLKKQAPAKKAKANVDEVATDVLKKQPSAKNTKPIVAQAEEEESEADEEEAAPPSANTSFRDKLIGNLKGSRFRFLNEQLYSSEGSSAVKLFRDDRAAFTAYHEGYRQQVQQWPLNPLDRIIKSIKKLPKTAVIADFGCGEGRLAKAVPNKTYSLDLVAQRHEIIACDMAKTPLETGSIDVAVYCLSLMGTNLRDFLLEANRVLRMNGLLKIAEVESRFEDVRTFVENIKACGFQHINTDTSSKFFVFLNFKKLRTVDRKQVPTFSLKPCLYKKR